MYNCEILADSISLQGNRLTTMKITFPRIMLAEFNTHRMFSRNSASSRAIPFKKMVKMVEENPFVPIAWQKSHKGMQGTEYETHKEHIKLNNIEWLEARDSAVNHAKILNDQGSVTKQLCNRLLEPFMWHTVIVTSSSWENFFKLRCPNYVLFSGDGFEHHFISKKDAMKVGWEANNEHSEGGSLLDWLQINKSQADIHIQAIAEMMWDAINESTPKQLKAGEWHIPFGDNVNVDKLSEAVTKAGISNTSHNEFVESKIKIATARCARISYQTLGDNPKIDYEADIKLHDRLLAMEHMSPFEHCARAMSNEEFEMYYNGKSTYHKASEGIFPYQAYGWCRNFRGFIQYRHLIENT